MIATRMVPVPKELFYDAGDRSADHVAMLRLRLIHPDDAVTMVAQGGVSPSVHPARVWSDFRSDQMADLDVGVSQGRMELAEEQVTAAIEQGRLRCVYVRHGLGSEVSLPPALREQIPLHDSISVIPPSALSGGDVAMSWDDGPYLTFEGEDTSWQASEFLLFWDEIVHLYPALAAEIPATPVIADGREEKRFTKASLRQSGLIDRRARSGRKVKPWGKAIGQLIKRVMQHGLSEAHSLSNKELGFWLCEEWESMGQPASAPEDAGRDARAVVDALFTALNDAPKDGATSTE